MENIMENIEILKKIDNLNKEISELKLVISKFEVQFVSKEDFKDIKIKVYELEKEFLSISNAVINLASDVQEIKDTVKATSIVLQELKELNIRQDISIKKTNTIEKFIASGVGMAVLTAILYAIGLVK